MTPDKVKAWLIDTLERAGATFVEYFAGTFGFAGLVAVANGDWHQAASLAHLAGAAAVAAAAAVVKAALAALKKTTVSPASFAPAQQPQQAQMDAPPPVKPKRKRRRDAGHGAVDLLAFVLAVILIVWLVSVLV